MIDQELQAQAKQEATRLREEIERRLASGEDIGLIDALFVVGWRGGNLSLLSQFVARGKVGGPLEAFSEISPAAWPHLRWDSSRCDDTAITREGKRIYEVQLWVPKEITVLDELDAGAPELPIERSSAKLQPASSMPNAGKLRTPIEVLRDIAGMATAGNRSPAPSRYVEKLSAAGLSLSTKGRVAGLSIERDGAIRTAAGTVGTELARLLIPVKFEIEHDRYQHFLSRCDVARDIITWLLAHHANIPTVDKLRDKLRNADGRSLDAVARELLPSFPSKPLLDV